jgi:hypothetical protein
MEIDSVSETLCFLVLEYQMIDKSQKPSKSVCIHHCQNPLEPVSFIIGKKEMCDNLWAVLELF